VCVCVCVCVADTVLFMIGVIWIGLEWNGLEWIYSEIELAKLIMLNVGYGVYVFSSLNRCHIYFEVDVYFSPRIFSQ